MLCGGLFTVMRISYSQTIKKSEFFIQNSLTFFVFLC